MGQTNLRPSNSFNWLTKINKQPRLVQLAMLSLPISIFCIFMSIYFLMSITLKINRTDFPPQEGQLLNRPSIEKAAKLLSEETIDFDINTN